MAVWTIGCRRIGKFHSSLGPRGRAGAATTAFLAFCRAFRPAEWVVQLSCGDQGTGTSLNIWAPGSVAQAYAYQPHSPLIRLCAHTFRQLGLKDPRAGTLWMSTLLRKRLKQIRNRSKGSGIEEEARREKQCNSAR